MPVQFEVSSTDRDIASEFESAFFDYLTDGATVGYNHSLELAPKMMAHSNQHHSHQKDGAMRLSMATPHHMLRRRNMEPNRITHHYNRYWNGLNVFQVVSVWVSM